MNLRPKAYAAVDTNVLIRSLSADANFIKYTESQPLPSAVRKSFASLVKNNQVIWLAHEEQLDEIVNVLDRVLQKGGTPNIRFTDQELINAQELLTYVQHLFERVKAGSRVQGIEYVPSVNMIDGKPSAGASLRDLACLFGNDISENIRDIYGKETNSITDTLIALSAYHKARELRQCKTKQASHVYIATLDKDFKVILSIIKRTFDEIRAQSSRKNYATISDSRAKLFFDLICYREPHGSDRLVKMEPAILLDFNRLQRLDMAKLADQGIVKV